MRQRTGRGPRVAWGSGEPEPQWWAEARRPASALQVWNGVWLTLSMLEVWLISLAMVCPTNPWVQPASALEVTFYLFNTCFYAADMAIHSRTAYIAPGGPIQDSKRAIWEHYLRGGFYADLFIALPWALCLLPLGSVAWQIGRWPRLLCPLRAYKLFQWSNSLAPMPGSIMVRPLCALQSGTRVRVHATFRGDSHADARALTYAHRGLDLAVVSLPDCAVRPAESFSDGACCM